MGQALRKFVPRSPRYVLRPQDDQLLRFALKDDQSDPRGTRFLNISLTGLGFAIDRKMAPPIGETLKIEFPIPGGQKIAWFGRVVRLEEPTSSTWWDPEFDRDDVIVGIEFQDLPTAHRSQIQRALGKKFLELQRERRQRLLQSLLIFTSRNFWRIVGLILCAVGTAAILYFMSRPGPDYDAQRGAPWGRRYDTPNPLKGW